jgi:methionyl aminopeptidase
MTKNMREKIEAMQAGGKRLAKIKQLLREAAVPGTRFEDLEKLAQEQISAEGALPSFSTVEGYEWATCITKNEGCCHGVPRGKKVEDGDIITIDVGLIFKGYHVDTTTTFYVGDESTADPKTLEFLKIGKEAMDKAIAKARIGNSVYDISKIMQSTIEEAGYSAVYQLTGHTIGKTLHEDPQIPCIAYKSDKKHKLYEGMTICVESMLAMGDTRLKVGDDGWTYETVDGSLSGMFEETVLITTSGPQILTS